MEISVIVGMAFEEMELPVICIFAESSTERTAGFGKTGNRETTVRIVLQTGISLTEEEHWDRWAEIEDAFDYQTTEMVRRLNEHSSEIAFQLMMEDIGMSNSVMENARMTEKRINFLTKLS
jgi:hypothetical protein